MNQLDLDIFRAGLPTFTAERCSSFAEAALYCLATEGHSSGTIMKVSGMINKDFEIIWKGKLTKQIKASWADEGEATEHGATAIAILLALNLTPYNTVERSVKGTGIDYWLKKHSGKSELPFQKGARLEISGIKKGGAAAIKRRATIKEKQSEQSDSTKLDAFIAIVEFGQPAANFIKR